MPSRDVKMVPSLKVIAALLLASGLACAKAPEELIRLDSLTTTRGKTYKKATVRDITPSGIKILHEGGTATLHYEEIPTDLRERVGGFDPEKARQYDEEEAQKLKEQRDQIERDLRKMEKDKEKDEKPAPSPDEAEDGDEKPSPTLDEDEDSTPTQDKDEKPAPKPSERATPASPQDPAEAAIDKGTLTARVIGYKTGVKRVEFRVITNCDAKLTVHNIPPYHHSKTFDITAKIPFVREIWVYNDYKSELLTPEGKKLDYENRTKKTETGRLTPAKLR